ncbi:hypothetical protein [Mycobacterium colombiense]|uniref:hypothetical protein n=1 Tax=Mycobacterium colombiense TaxID=339268 RepID=UPI000A4699E3|nr:hypothetical protein [Mycobacterium colombiense]
MTLGVGSSLVRRRRGRGALMVIVRIPRTTVIEDTALVQAIRGRTGDIVHTDPNPIKGLTPRRKDIL